MPTRSSRKKEERLNLCVPGGKETARMLKSLTRSSARPRAVAAATAAAGDGHGTHSRRSAPAARATIRSTATFLSRTRLNKPGSEKETWHIEFDLADTGLDYTVGDSFGVFPANDPGAGRCRHRGARRAAGFSDRRPHPARGADRRRVARRPRPTCCSSCSRIITGGERRQKAKALAAGEDPDGDAATLDVLAAIEKFPGMRPDPEAFIEALDPLQPRLYSISSSPKADPGRVVAHRRCRALRDRQAHAARRRLDLPRPSASQPGDQLKVYVQKAHAFGLPADPQRRSS